MTIFTKYGNRIIPNSHWEWPLRIEFLQWVFQPHSGRNVDDVSGNYITKTTCNITAVAGILLLLLLPVIKGLVWPRVVGAAPWLRGPVYYMANTSVSHS